MFTVRWRYRDSLQGEQPVRDTMCFEYAGAMGNVQTSLGRSLYYFISVGGMYMFKLRIIYSYRLK